MQAVETIGIQQWNRALRNQQKNLEKNNLVLVIMLCGFQRVINHTQGSLLRNGLNRIEYNTCYQITLYYW